MGIRFIISLILVCLLSGCRGEQENVWVEDKAGLLKPEQIERLNRYHAVLFDDLDVQFKVITLAEKVTDIDQTAAELFGHLGAETDGARGLLFLIDSQGKQVRLEVGYDLEHILPDGFIARIEVQQMKPFFARDMAAQGIEATGELLVKRMLNEDLPVSQRPLSPVDQQYYSGGGGAKIDTDAGPEQYQKNRVDDPIQYGGAGTPEEALKQYEEVLQRRIKDPDLSLYTPETRQFFSQWIVTDAQQNNELRVLREHVPDKVDVQNGFAVIRFPISERTMPPYFLKFGDNGWMFDFATMSKVIGMNHLNQWRMRSFDHPYMFGFNGLEFDANGFPFYSSEK